MPKSVFDPSLPLRYVRYGRMSTDRQNPRSPDQQFGEIARVLWRLHYPWTLVCDFRDDGISGRVIKGRPGLQRMLREIKSGNLQVDVIAVDTFERFGRADELAEERRILYVRHGVLILTADSGFADPNSPQGRALSMVESMRSTEEGRIKGLNVLRGKRDAVLQGYWPGGLVPFGFRLESVMGERDGRQVVLHSVVRPDPATAWISKFVYELAYKTQWGATRIAAALNADLRISSIKVFHASTVADILDNHLYHGDMFYGEKSVSIIDDRRVVEKNPEEDVLYVRDYCPSIVSREVSLAVKKLRRQRGAIIAARMAKAHADCEKQIAAPAPGIALEYPVSGLLRCGLCNRAMTAGAGGAYETQAGEVHRYVRYRCPVHRSGACPNGIKVPEPWIRETVTQLIRTRVLEQDKRSFQHLVELVRRHLQERIAAAPDVRPQLEKELGELQEQMSGWSQTLGKPTLSPALRSKCEADYDAALLRQQEIEQQIAGLEHLQRTHEVNIDDAAIIERLDRLATLLGGDNATATNVELSAHIDWIRAYPDGSVIVRTSRLGALAECKEALQSVLPVRPAAGDSSEVRGRRRPRLQLVDPERSHDELDWAVHNATDLDRFAGLPEELFWYDEFEIPVRKSWAETHAVAVAMCRLEGLTHEAIAGQFEKAVPTVRAALRHAERLDSEIAAALAKLQPKMPRARWHEVNAEKVLKRCETLQAELHLARTPMKQLVAEFDKSEPTIRKALEHAREKRCESDHPQEGAGGF